MGIDFGSVEEQTESKEIGQTSVKVIGVGGGGGNVVNRMIVDAVEGVEYIVANTDEMVLRTSLAPIRLGLGAQTTKGLGAGMKPEVGRMAAEEDQERLKEALEDADMVFIAAGMGGGTGTGAAPIIAEIAREMKILTVGVVTTPFKFEGRRRARIANEGIEELKKHIDTLMVIPNEKLLSIASQQTTMQEAFAMADEVLKQAIAGITHLINLEGVINLDFADVKTVMSNKGRAIMGTGTASGENRGLEAARRAISSPLLNDIQISGATGVIINIVADPNFSLLDAQAAAELIETSADADADIIFGFVQDDDKADYVSVTVIATGFEKESDEQLDLTSDKQILRVGDSLKKKNSPVIAEETVPPKMLNSSLEEKKVVEPVEIAQKVEEKLEKAPPLEIKEEKKEEKVEQKPINTEEEVLELDQGFIKPIEKSLHYPPHLKNNEPKKKNGKEEVDYDIPTFIRRKRGL